MAEAATKPKKAKVLSEESKKRKRESDKIRARTRINIGTAFARWRELKEEEGCPTDTDLAVMLLDYHVRAGEVVVQLECLLQLFQRCFECCSICSIRKSREGRFLNVTQKCQQCQASRKWRSHPPEQIIRDPTSNQEVVEETVLLSFGDSDSESDEEVKDYNLLSQEEEDQINQSEEDLMSQSEEEVKGHHPPNQTFVGEGCLAETSDDLGHTRTEKVNNSVIHTPGASNNRLHDQEEDDKNDSHSSVSWEVTIVDRMEEEKSEVQEPKEEMEHEDEVADVEEDLERQDSVDDDWYPNCEDVEQSSASEDKDSDAEFVPRPCRKSKRELNSDPYAEPILPLVWCSLCGSRFKHTCFRQRHSRLYGCLQCGIKTKKMDTSGGNKEDTPTNNQETNNSCNQDSFTSSNQETVRCENQDTCSNQGTIRCDEQNISNGDNQGPDSGSRQWTATDGNQSGSGSSQGMTTSSCTHETSCCKVRSPGIRYIDIQGLDYIGHQVANKNAHEESFSLNTETFPDGGHSQAVHIEDLAVHFKSLSDFQNHALKCHGIRPLRTLCVDCGKFLTMVNLVDGGPRHICEHKVKPIVCPSCGKRFATEVGLQTHNDRIHSEKYSLTCRYCLEAFKSPEDKEEHEKSHEAEVLKYHCPDCSLRFSDRPSWCAHRKSHWPNGKHICEVCNKGFRFAVALIRHMAIHTGQKPYSCKLCDRSFNQPGHLKSHMRLHTGERPFKCQDCGQCFNHNVSLKNHIQRHHGPGADKRNSGKGGKDGIRRKKKQLRFSMLARCSGQYREV
ncbi:zinc finger protein 629-like isoform X2 [Alosa alosa]|uniref:zinc finger protein 629-like isoform X2 n=1 Tax=Alosa alosa TaxID=278164 RepID=UPI0020152B21|nr:zinc finger protein 629-like isoform X2 [Alosa alosa]